MAYTPDSSLRDPAQGSQEQWVTALETHGADEAAAIVAAYFTLAPEVDLNADLALAQAVHETGWFRSRRWIEQRNPAGIGITSDSVPGENFGSIEGGVKAHLAHLCCYVYSRNDCPIEAQLGWFDPRHFFHDNRPAVRDLIRPDRRWADPGTGYVASLVRIVNDVGALVAAAQDDNTLLERFWRAHRDELGAQQFAGLLRRPDFGNDAADSYPLLVCERGAVIVVNGAARDVTERCIDDFIKLNKEAGTLQPF